MPSPPVNCPIGSDPENLTTLGYGDIAPLSGSARALSTLEALIGQIYLAVLIARLVGIHAAQGSGE